MRDYTVIGTRGGNDWRHAFVRRVRASKPSTALARVSSMMRQRRPGGRFEYPTIIAVYEGRLTNLKGVD
jgi:hypothetical protein|tara:strand:- start:11783 stop:11989 length:207 start_codon:yes stop_codon:yes gene_type:complete